MYRENSHILVPEKTELLGMQTVGQSDAFLDKWLRQSLGEVIPGTKLVAIFTAGMRRGGITTGVLSGLRDQGLTPDGLQAVVGSSVGGTIAREYVGNNINALRGLFADDRRKTPRGMERMIFLKKLRPPLVNFIATEELFRREGAPEAAVKAAKPEVYVGLRDLEKGSRELVNIREVEDTVDLAISTMTMVEITERNQRPVVNTVTGESKMSADPFYNPSELIKFAVNELGATDVGVFFTTNPFETSRVNTAFDYLMTFLDHMRNRKHLFQAIYNLRYADKSPEYFKKLFSGQTKVNMAGFYPGQVPIAPNETNLELMARVISEAELFGNQQGIAARQRMLASQNC